jgi:gag-polypeptide of LTR copia-type
MRSLADELTFVGSPISDDDLVLQVLGGLDSDYNSFVVAANTKDQLSFNELQAMLQSHENLLQSQTGSTFSPSLLSPQNPVAFFASSKSGLSRNSHKPKRGGFRPNGQGSFLPPLLPNPCPRPNFSNPRPSFPRPPQSVSVPNPARQIICQICFKRGHQARNCWYRV